MFYEECFLYGNVLWKDVLFRMFCIRECFIKGRFLRIVLWGSFYKWKCLLKGRSVNGKILLRDVLWGMSFIWECFVKGRFVKNVFYAMGCFFAGTSCTLHPYVYSILYSYIFLTPKAMSSMVDVWSITGSVAKKHFSFHFYIFLVVGGFELWQIHYSKHLFWDGERSILFLFSPFSFTQTNV